MRDVAGRLRDLYGTGGDVLLMTSSGTGGLESAIQNVFSPGDEVLVPNAGFFADRLKSSPSHSGSSFARWTTTGDGACGRTTSGRRSKSIR